MRISPLAGLLLSDGFRLLFLLFGGALALDLLGLLGGNLLLLGSSLLGLSLLDLLHILLILLLLLFFFDFEWLSGIVNELLQSVHRNLSGGGDSGGQLISTSSVGDLAALALPNTNGLSLDGSLHYFESLPFHRRGRHTWRAAAVRTS